jgi:hypothetical protein
MASEFFRRPMIRDLKFDALEARSGRTLETVEKRNFVE